MSKHNHHSQNYSNHQSPSVEPRNLQTGHYPTDFGPRRQEDPTTMLLLAAYVGQSQKRADNAHWLAEQCLCAGLLTGNRLASADSRTSSVEFNESGCLRSPYTVRH
jgi:hypothetical protein